MTDQSSGASAGMRSKKQDRALFVACFIALVATAFAFNIRANVVGTWQSVFGLSETQKGEILGALFWPFGISIVLFSLIIDRIGYGKSMIFAFVCHVASVVVTIYAKGHWWLYAGSCLCGLAAGTVEAVVNPVVASMYPRNKTKMLTILHAGWAGGIALCGVIVLTLGMIKGVGWETKVMVLLLPTAVYGIMMLNRKFPVSERVAAGVPYRDMLKECGVFGALIVSYMIMMEVCRVFQMDKLWGYAVVLVLLVAIGTYTKSLGRFMYSFLLLVMILLAITELGTDGWMKELRDPAMRKIGLDGGWILVYTATIMMVLRFCIGPIVRVLKPLGVLFVSSLFAAAGLYLLSGAEGAWLILITATVYGVGQAYFWPVTIGLCSERFPKGGTLTINAVAGVGMLGVGIIGFPLMGYIQDTRIEKELNPAIHREMVSSEPMKSVLGEYRPLDKAKVNKLKAQVELHNRRQAVSKELPAGARLADALAKDDKYQALLTDTYNLLVRAAGDKGDKSFGEMNGALAAGGFFLTDEQYAKLSEEWKTLDATANDAKRVAMARIALLPIIMAVCYLGLILYFKARGGYKAVDISAGGEVTGEHKVAPNEAVADAEAAPSE